MFSTPKKSGHQMAKNGRRKAMKQEELDELKQRIAVTSRAHRPFIFDKPAAAVEDDQRSMTLTATRVFVA